MREDDSLLLTWTPGSGEQVSLIKASNLQTFTRARKGISLIEGRALQVVKL
jgi:hypothetical protein